MAIKCENHFILHINWIYLRLRIVVLKQCYSKLNLRLAIVTCPQTVTSKSSPVSAADHWDRLRKRAEVQYEKKKNNKVCTPTGFFFVSDRRLYRMSPKSHPAETTSTPTVSKSSTAKLEEENKIRRGNNRSKKHGTSAGSKTSRKDTSGGKQADFPIELVCNLSFLFKYDKKYLDQLNECLVKMDIPPIQPEIVEKFLTEMVTSCFKVHVSQLDFKFTRNFTTIHYLELLRCIRI